MAGRGRATETASQGGVLSKAIAATLGLEARATRGKLRRSQAEIAAEIGLSRARYAELEAGDGGQAPLELWVKVGVALGRPLAVGFSRDISGDGVPADPRDAGHLEAQELVLRLARAHGRRSNVELATRPHDPSLMADVVSCDDRLRALMLIEIVNRAGDLGATARSTERKAAELERMAILLGGDDGPYRVARGWLLVDSAANRRLATKHQEFLRTRHPGSSTAWARAIADGTEPPRESAVAWIDPRSGRISPIHWKG